MKKNDLMILVELNQLVRVIYVGAERVVIELENRSQCVVGKSDLRELTLEETQEVFKKAFKNLFDKVAEVFKNMYASIVTFVEELTHFINCWQGKHKYTSEKWVPMFIMDDRDIWVQKQRCIYCDDINYKNPNVKNKAESLEFAKNLSENN